MQTGISPQFITAIGLNNKRVLELFEFYASDETNFIPTNALKTYAKTTVNWGGRLYTRQVVGRSTAKRYLGRDTNTVTVTFGANSEEMVRFITNNRVEGMWLQIRRISLDVPNESTIIFGGRCGKPDNRGSRITAKQEIGGGAQIPARRQVFQCPLEFKGKACLGGQAITAKSAAYKAASSCNKSSKQCSDYGNFDNFAAFRFIPVVGNFTASVTELSKSFFGRLFGRKKIRQVSAPWSSVSDASQDAVIPEIAGITQSEFVPIVHADTGANVKSLQAVADGEMDQIFSVTVKDKQYLPNLINFHQALGKFGSDGQPDSLLFTGAGKFSGTSWVEFEVTGSNPSDANDASPQTVGIIRGRKMPLPNPSGEWNVNGWTDVGPVMLRFYLNELGRHPLSQMDDESFIQAFIDCNEPVIDDTGFDQAVIPAQTTQLSFKAFALALGFGAPTVDRIALMMAQGKVITGGYGQLVEAYYRYINQQQPPVFISSVRRLRRRYTTNFVLTDQNDLKTFIYDVLLQSFNGYLIFNSQGQISVKVDKKQPGSFILDAPAAGTNTMLVEDATVWRNRLGSQILIGAHLKHSEVRRVKDWSFSTWGNTIAVTVASTGGIGISVASATLSGGNSATPANTIITLTGTATAGQTITITVDGIPITYTTNILDDEIAVAGLLAATINGHPTLRRYIRADWNDAQGLQIYLYCKAGILTLDQPLTNSHFNFEEILCISMAFGGAGQHKFIADSFDWLLSSRQSSANQFNGKFISAVNDWAKLPISRDYEDHQKYVHAVYPEEINLSAVDSANQAARLLKIYGGQRRLCDWFCSFGSNGEATLLDVGDLICVSHWTGYGEIVNVPVVIEEIEDNEDATVNLVARLYRSDIYDDIINEMSPVYMMPLDGSTPVNTDNPPADNSGGTGTPGDSGGGGTGPIIIYPQDGYGSGGGEQPDRGIFDL